MPVPRHPMQAPRPRLLIVDDDRAILTLVGTIALNEGFDVATAVGGEDALRQLRPSPSDLVLLDLRMPGVTGLDVLRAIADVSHGCRVVLMSDTRRSTAPLKPSSSAPRTISQSLSIFRDCASCWHPCAARPSGVARCSISKGRWRSDSSSAG